MSSFEILILVLLCIFVLSNLYFNVSERVIGNKQRKLDNERVSKQIDFEKTIEALSLKVYEFQSENLKLNNQIKDWVTNYNKLIFAYNKAQAELERYRNKENKDDEKTPIKSKPEKEEIIVEEEVPEN